jgi:hypothetical protein
MAAVRRHALIPPMDAERALVLAGSLRRHALAQLPASPHHTETGPEPLERVSAAEGGPALSAAVTAR